MEKVIRPEERKRLKEMGRKLSMQAITIQARNSVNREVLPTWKEQRYEHLLTSTIYSRLLFARTKLIWIELMEIDLKLFTCIFLIKSQPLLSFCCGITPGIWLLFSETIFQFRTPIRKKREEIVYWRMCRRAKEQTNTHSYAQRGFIE